MRPWQQCAGRFAAACTALAGATYAAPTVAHPHVWVSVEATVLYEKGTIAGLRQRWTFDEFYSAMAVQGLDANNDGNYVRSELAELTKVNVEGLKDYGYFTFARLGEQQLAFDAPKESWMEYTEAVDVPEPAATVNGAGVPPLAQSGSGKSVEKPKVLSLEFILPMKQPIPAGTEGFNFSIYDPSFFIRFDLVKDRAVRLAGSAPQGCKAEVGTPGKDGAQLQQLGEAFFNQSGGANVGSAWPRR
jgi:ABC-type uncharacterized transport system substrate-binding protein